MHKVAAYLLERRDGLDWPDARKSEGEKIRTCIEAWLKSKGATDGGAYVSEDGSDATFRVTRAEDGERSWTMYTLDEASPDGRRFSASLSVTVGARAVAVYVTLEVGSASSEVNAIEADARCPKVVRELLGSAGSWYHGASRLRPLTHVRGFDDGETLALEINHGERTIPFVVVSTMNGSPVLPQLDERLAYDLAGIANVFTVDEAATWALTDTLRKPLSCYAGAVRVYWPRLRLDDNPFRHHLWTASRLTSLEPDEMEARDRFRRQLRRLIMRASAAGVVRPREIDEIRNAAARAEFAALKARAKSLEDFESLANSYAKDNDALREELLQKDAEIEALQNAVAKLESEKEGLVFHLRQARPEAAHDVAADDVEPDPPEGEIAEPAAPDRGEVRFYKKKYAAPTHDVMVRVGDCGHNSWQGAAKADKAKKGIARLEGNRDDWQTVQHCGRCTGGGMWRVQW